MSVSRLNLTAACDDACIAARTVSQRIIEWVVQAPDHLHTPARLPLNLALVLDRSGSMQGDKLRYVQQAAGYVIEQLGASDRVAVVAYDDTTQTLTPSTLVTSPERSQILTDIQALQPGGMTNLTEGWLRGCSQIAEHRIPDGIHRVLLLTDGLANRGIVDRHHLLDHASAVRQDGITTSTFGVGSDFNEHLLKGIATDGGGNFYSIERSDQIPQFFRGELGELFTIVARNAYLTITIPDRVEIEYIGDQPYDYTNQHLRIFLGELCAGEERSVHIRVTIPPGAVERRIAVCGELCYTNGATEAVALQATQSFLYSDNSQRARAPRNSALLERAHLVELATAAMHTLDMNAHGEEQAGVMLLKQALNASERYVPPAIVREYHDLVERLEQRCSHDEKATYTRSKLRSTVRSHPSLHQIATALLQQAGYAPARRRNAGFLLVQTGSQVEIWHDDSTLRNTPHRQQVYERMVAAYARALQGADLACVTTTNALGDPCVRLVSSIIPAHIQQHVSDLMPGSVPLLSLQYATGEVSERLWIQACLTIGRHTSNDIVIPHRQVSRQHATLEQQADACYIRDLDSTNGTFVNGTFLNGSRRLRDHDTILIADTTIIFHDART